MSAARCPGCGLVRAGETRDAHAYLNCSPGCWQVYGGVLAREYSDPVLLAEAHGLTVDAYAAQHAGGRHPDRSVGIHLVGLLLVLERGVPPSALVPVRRRLARREAWPRLAQPRSPGALTVADVAVAPHEHAAAVRRWAEEVWAAWSDRHDVVRALADETPA